MSASISGVVYNDVNVANTIKPGDPMLSGVRVYVDLGNHGAYQAGDPTAITNAQGAYTINGLGAGPCVLREVVPSHFRQTEPLNGAAHDLTLVATSHLTNVNFGDTQKVRVSGTVFNDSNGDGIQNHGEAIVSNVIVYLDKNGDKHFDAGDPYTKTNSLGYWVIGNLPFGKTYSVRVAPPAGFVQTDPMSNGGYSETLQSGQTGDNLAFGIRPSTLVINSQKRAASVFGGSHTKVLTSTNVGTFNANASVTDPVLGDGGSSDLTSSIGANKFEADGTLAAIGDHDEGGASVTIDITFTISAATAYSTSIDIGGNNYSFELKKVGGGDVFNNVPSSDFNVMHYDFSKSGTLAAGKYELIFQAYQDNSNIFYTSDYGMTFNV